MIRKALFAGSWYPADQQTLKLLISESIETVLKNTTYQHCPCRFAVLPHAGLFYSKTGIAPFFAADLSKIQRLVVLAPSHYANLSPDCLVSAPLDGLETPLGMFGKSKPGQRPNKLLLSNPERACLGDGASLYCEPFPSAKGDPCPDQSLLPTSGGEVHR
jgi:hypothetical protein